MSDILFIKTSSLGDVIRLMPAVADARKHDPGARIAWVVEREFAPLVLLHRAVDAVIPVVPWRWGTIMRDRAVRQQVRDFVRDLRHPFNVVIDTQGKFGTAFVARVARGRRHGFAMRSADDSSAALLYNVRHKVDRGLHAVARNRRLTALALGYEADEPPDFGLDRAHLSHGSAGRYAVLLHGTEQEEKEWPVQRWIALGAALELRGYDVVLPWGNEREQARSERIAAVLKRARVSERRPLDELARLIAGAALAVGLDTGLTHLAAALGVPLVAVFVTGDPELTGPVGAGPIAIIGPKEEEMPAADEVIGAAAGVA